MDQKRILPIFLFTLLFFFLNQYLFPIRPQPIVDTQDKKEEIRPIKLQVDNKPFYQLANDKVMLLFSEHGNLSQVLLAFSDAIRPTKIDRQVTSCYKAIGPGHTTQQITLDNYYPLLKQSGQKEHEAFALTTPTHENLPPLNLVEHTKNKIVFQGNGVKKTFFLKDNYLFDVSLEFDYPQTDLWLTSGICDTEMVAQSSQTYVKYNTKKNDGNEINELKLPDNKTLMGSLSYQWICLSNGPFGMILASDAPIHGLILEKVASEKLPGKLVALSTDEVSESIKSAPGYQSKIPVSNQKNLHLTVFAGPFQNKILAQADPQFTDAQTSTGFFSSISKPFSKFLFILLDFFHSLTGSWGLSIILLTIVLRIMLYPLNAWSIRSNLKMQKLGPKIKAIQEKYKKDPQKRSLEQMKLYREEGANPLTGCFPLLIQAPFLFGMFDLLRNTFQLRGASFIPGWIDNLSEPDVLFSWGFPIIFIGASFHLLPILNGFAMLFQQRISNPLPKDPTQMTDQQRQQRAVGSLMTIFIAFIFYNFPSGLNLYWLSSTLLGIGQQYVMKKYSKK
jgi:YidC/Oxa1 family membrane protein insertase